MTFPVKLDYNSITLLISVVALIISIIALVYTIASYLLKRGNKIRCDISKCLPLRLKKIIFLV